VLAFLFLTWSGPPTGHMSQELDAVVARPRLYFGIACVCVSALTVLAVFVYLRKTRAPADDYKPEERQLAILINAARIRERLPDLLPDPALDRVARAHAQVMAREKRVHYLDDMHLRYQAKRAGYVCADSAMIVDCQAALDLPSAFDRLMDTEAHRLMVLHDRYGHSGVGIARDDEGFFYLVQVYARRK
jgi:uncharacterized protein YkwD